jgi:hypothetical protein
MSEKTKALWIESWHHSQALLFRLIPTDEINGIEACGALLARLRESRLTLRGAPDPLLGSLAQSVLDDLWRAATLSLYGDLVPARAHIAAARERAGQIQALIEAVAA